MANSRKSKSSDLTGRADGALKSVVPAGSSILLGLSGGVDSVVLLHLLAQISPRYSWKLSALHVHHGISPRADEWAVFCAELCACHGVPLKIERVNIAPLRDKGIEAAARELRYEAFLRQPSDFIALAHHQDDQAETLLLQLLRGAGVKGVAAMAPVKNTARQLPLSSDSPGSADMRQFLPPCRGKDRMGVEQCEDNGSAPSPTLHPQGVRRGCTGLKPQQHTQPLQGGGGICPSPVLLRPLLDISRAELEAYAEAHALTWVEDESNADESYPRNFLRCRVLPLLEQRFPACRATLARGARHFAEADALLDVLAEQDAQGAFDGGTLDVTRLAEFDAMRAKNLLRWFLQRRGALMPENPRLEEMLRQLRVAREDAQVCIAWGGWEMRRYRGRVHVCTARAEPAADFVVTWRGEESLALSGGVLCFVHCRGEGVSARKLAAEPVTIRLRRGEETLRPDAARPARSLRYLFQEYGIPPWQRAGWPLLYCGETLAAVPEIGVECAWRAAPDEEGVVLRWVQV